MKKQKAWKKLMYLIRDLLPKKLRRWVAFFGDFLCRDFPDRYPTMAGTLWTLRRLGFRPQFCIDVGAYHGEWTKLLKSIFPESKICMIEAQKEKKEVLEAVSKCFPGTVQSIICCLDSKNKKRINFYEMETGSSAFPELSEVERRTVKVATRSLDSLAAEKKFQNIDLLKLDVQGYEIEILRGARRVLKRVTAVLLEASVIQINQGAPKIFEVLCYMKKAGFQLFDFCGQARTSKGVLLQTDLLFINNHCPFVKKIKT